MKRICLGLIAALVTSGCTAASPQASPIRRGESPARDSFFERLFKRPRLASTDLPAPQIISDIFRKKDGTLGVRFADISKADPIEGCPIETTAGEIKAAVDQLVSQANESVGKIQQSSQNECAQLARKIERSRDQFYTVMTQFMLTNVLASPEANQDEINEATRRANAINEIIVTTGDFLESRCVPSIDDRVSIQKTVGQVLSVSGLIAGGVPGVFIAGIGQVLARFPGFKTDIEKAVEAFRDYQKRTSESSFLCTFRQLQKTSCLLFSTPDDHVVSGVDLDFRTGTSKKTLEAINQLKRDHPELLDEIRFLKAANQTSFDSLDAFSEFCRSPIWSPLLPSTHFPAEKYPSAIHDNFIALRNSCGMILNFEFPAPNSVASYLNEQAGYAEVLSSYYQFLRDDEVTYGQSVRLYESLLFFRNLKDTIEPYRNSESGNLFRMSFLGLVDRLEETIAESSFSNAFEKQEDFFEDSTSPSIRERAARSLVELCQTFDPTLTCLYVDTSRRELQATWEKRCAGAHSRLCLLDDLRTHLKTSKISTDYYDSLCKP